MQNTRELRVLDLGNPSTPAGSPGKSSPDQAESDVDSFESEIKARYGEGSVEKYRRKLFEEFGMNLKPSGLCEEASETLTSKEDLLREAKRLLDAVKEVEEFEENSDSVQHINLSTKTAETQGVSRINGEGEDGNFIFKKVTADMGEKKGKEVDPIISDLTKVKSSFVQPPQVLKNDTLLEFDVKGRYLVRV